MCTCSVKTLPRCLLSSTSIDEQTTQTMCDDNDQTMHDAYYSSIVLLEQPLLCAHIATTFTPHTE
jgi:hypothetical protein